MPSRSTTEVADLFLNVIKINLNFFRLHFLLILNICYSKNNFYFTCLFYFISIINSFVQVNHKDHDCTTAKQLIMTAIRIQ